MTLTRPKPSQWARNLAPRVNAPTIPDLQGFTTLYGVKVVAIGEDGDLVAFGHVGKLRALAAFNAYARKVYGFAAERSGGVNGPSPALHQEGDSYVNLDEALSRVHHEWATNDAPLDDWILRPARKDAPGAFPVTMWRY